MYKIIQWNCRGLIHKSRDLSVLLAEHDPMCVCLQETHLGKGQPYKLENYSTIRKDDDSHQRKCGGVAFLLRNSASYREISINTNLQCIAVEVYAPIKITICNIYLPKYNWCLADLNSIVDQLPPPFMIVGDFNAHSVNWGSTKTDARGREIERWLERDDLVILNTGSPTSLNTKSRTFAAIDLTIASSKIAASFQWQTAEHRYGSDHFPLLIVPCRNTSYKEM